MRALTRREALAGAAALPLFAAGEAHGVPRDDRALLQALLDIERRAAIAYSEAAASRKLGRRMTGLAELFSEQNREHVTGLTESLRNRGGRPTRKPDSPTEVAGLLEALDADRRGLLRFLAGLAEIAIARYLDAIEHLRDPRLRTAAVTIVAAEGQHLAVLREALGERAVPSAFAGG